eukprot:13965164-Ditylum_brightwellii.AAC.1
MPSYVLFHPTVEIGIHTRCPSAECLQESQKEVRRINKSNRANKRQEKPRRATELHSKNISA